MTLLGRFTFSSIITAVLFGAPLAAAHMHDVRAVDPREDSPPITNDHPTAGESTSESTTPSSAMEVQQIDDEVSFAVSTHCRYDVRVTGTVEKIAGGDEPLYQPDLRIATTITCPSGTSTSTFEGLGGGQAMTGPQLARDVSKWSSFHRSNGWEHCAYTPGVRLDDSGLAFGNVKLLCRPFRAVPI
jgi:hypothetical protein